MTTKTLSIAAVIRERLSADLDAAVQASAAAHEAAQGHTDAVLACLHLPAEVYQYAPHLAQASASVTAASRALTGVTRDAIAHPTPDSLYTLRQATAALASATAVLRGQTAALLNAAGWFGGAVALPS